MGASGLPCCRGSCLGCLSSIFSSCRCRRAAAVLWRMWLVGVAQAPNSSSNTTTQYRKKSRKNSENTAASGTIQILLFGPVALSHTLNVGHRYPRGSNDIREGRMTRMMKNLEELEYTRGTPTNTPSEPKVWQAAVRRK